PVRLAALDLFSFFFVLLFVSRLCLLHFFPTRRSSDLTQRRVSLLEMQDQSGYLRPGNSGLLAGGAFAPYKRFGQWSKRLYGANADRKSTRLNSSHDSISYAVFFLNNKILYTYVILDII